MIEIGTDCRPSMALELTPQREQEAQGWSPGNLFLLTQAGPSWWVRLDGKIVAVGGYVVQWEGRAILWGYIGANARPAMFAMTRAIKKELAKAGFVRYEAMALVRHKAAREWLELLGFRKEGVAKKYMSGRDYVLYARVT